MDWYWCTRLNHVVSNLSKIRQLVLREQRERDQNAVGRNGDGAASVQIIVVWHPHLAGVPVVVDDAKAVNATLVDMVTAAAGQASDVERHDGAENRVLGWLVRPLHIRHPAVVAVEQLPLTTTCEN
jgi:hypothetical protein